MDGVEKQPAKAKKRPGAACILAARVQSGCRLREMHAWIFTILYASWVHRFRKCEVCLIIGPKTHAAHGKAFETKTFVPAEPSCCTCCCNRYMYACMHVYVYASTQLCRHACMDALMHGYMDVLPVRHDICKPWLLLFFRGCAI